MCVCLGGAYMFSEAAPNIKFISFYSDFFIIKENYWGTSGNTFWVLIFFGKLSFFKLFIFADVFLHFLRMKQGMFAGFQVSTTQKFFKNVFLKDIYIYTHT